MAALQASLLVVLAAVCGLSASESTSTCELVVDVVYPSVEGESPYPECSSQCDSDQSGIWYQGVAYRRYPALRDEYQQMVAANYLNGDLVSCTLVPYKTTDQLTEEAAARKAAEAMCGRKTVDIQVTEDDSVPDASVTDATTVLPTTTSIPTTTEQTTPAPPSPAAPNAPEPTSAVEPTTSAPTTPEPTTPVPTTPEPTTPAPTTPEPTTPAPTTPKPTTPKPTTTTTPKATTTTPKPIVYTCPSGHYKFKDASCYIVPGHTDDWEDAYKYCRDRGYSMAMIESADEQKFVAGLINDDIWIDLNDRDSEGNFRFTNGRSTPYTNWARGEPNNDWWREDCVEMKNDDSYRWNDKNCGNSRRFVCEKPTTRA